MTYRSLTTTCALAAVVVLTALAARPTAQKNDKDTIAALAAKMTGTWQLNVPETTAASAGLALPQAPQPRRGADSGGGRSGGGGGGGGRGGGGSSIGGSMSGKRGGDTNTGSSGSGMSDRDAAELAALVTEVRTKPDTLTLQVTATELSVTFPGTTPTSRVYPIGKKIKMKMGDADIPTSTKWDKGVLTQELNIGDLKLIKTFEITPEDRLKVSMSFEGTGAKHVYDRAKTDK